MNKYSSIAKGFKIIGATLFASLALSSYPAMATDWPPLLDPNPAVQPPKWDWQLAVPVKEKP